MVDLGLAGTTINKKLLSPRRAVCVTLLIFGLLLAISSCRRAAEDSGPPEKVTLAIYAGGYGFMPYIAREKGYFQENGLDVTFREYAVGLKATEALFTGEADIGTGAEFVVVSYSFDHPELRILSSIATSEVCEVIASKDRGISRPSDLRGKRIGVTFKTKAEFFLARFLVYNKITMADVEFVDIPSPQLKEALAGGKVDAVATWEPFAQEIRAQLGPDAISWPTQSGQEFYYLLISREEWVKRHPETIRRLLKALVQTEAFIKSNPAEAQGIVGRLFGYSPEFVTYLWRKNRFAVDLPQSLLLMMEDGAEWRIENRRTGAKKIPNYLGFIYFDGLEAVKPQAVTIIH